MTERELNEIDLERIADDTIDDDTCECGSIEHGFNCVCDWVTKHQGDIEYSCEFCGIYTASVPQCNKCECEPHH